MGTASESFIELTERIGRKTGGLSVYPFTSAKRGQEEPIAKLIVSSRGPGWGSGTACVTPEPCVVSPPPGLS
jgi:hypothetical protein